MAETQARGRRREQQRKAKVCRIFSAHVAFLFAIGLAGCGGGAATVSYGTISTVAGNGTPLTGSSGAPADSGDGGASTAARLNQPTCVAADAAGNVYIGDFTVNVVRRISTAGTITTYAGNRTAGYSGDGGPATAAQLNGPAACTLDAAGNLYIADSTNNVIRRIAAGTGIITTVAGNGLLAGTASGGFSGDGGQATVAQINHPFGIAVDSAGNLYIADTQNYRIRKVTPGGVISTIAGVGTYGFSGDGAAATAAQLYNPEGLALDSSGNIYIAEQANSRIRKITVSDGTISTIAGNGMFFFLGDGHSAKDAQLNGPVALAFGSNGDLYIADSGNVRIRRILANGNNIQTVAGSDAQGFKGDGGPATDAQLNFPKGIAFGPGGVLYIADSANGSVRKVTP